MEANVLGIKTLKVIIDLNRKGIKKYVALMRHSEKHYGTVENDLMMRLTEEGKLAAYEFGRALPSGSLIQFFSSSVHRCIETSDLINEGCLSCGGKTKPNTVAFPLSPFFINKDDTRALQMSTNMAGDYPRFFRNWFDGKIPCNLIGDARQASQTLLDYLLELMQEPKEKGNICITHDWHLILIKEYLLGQRPEEFGNIDYLEGVIIYKKKNNYFITNLQNEEKILKTQHI